MDRLLLGGQNGLTAHEFSTAMGDLLWPSTPVSAGPHVDLLTRPDRDRLTDAEILNSPYGRMATTTIAQTGNFFSATHDGDVPRLARQFVAHAAQPFSSTLHGVDATARSIPGSDIRVARIKHSDCFQVVDGHHRLAMLTAAGSATARVRTAWLGVTTPLQETLDAMTWIGGQRELYQPLPAPELAKSWRTVRRCTDRRDAMLAFLTGPHGVSSGASYLDVASCYGWFVAQMAKAGLDAWGVERDPLALVVGEAAYALDPSRIAVGNAEVLLAAPDQRWDVVSCLSLLHHFALGRASIGPEKFVRMLDRATAKVLFLDTGQSHEEWLKSRLPGWETDDVRAFLTEFTTFDEVIDLGPDADAVPPYAANYGRHLFACVRHE